MAERSPVSAAILETRKAFLKRNLPVPDGLVIGPSLEQTLLRELDQVSPTILMDGQGRKIEGRKWMGMTLHSSPPLDKAKAILAHVRRVLGDLGNLDLEV